MLYKLDQKEKVVVIATSHSSHHISSTDSYYFGSDASHMTNIQEYTNLNAENSLMISGMGRLSPYFVKASATILTPYNCHHTNGPNSLFHH